ncbi:hypothetical protein SpCBS45565_g05217 [Spizellomyces sp. 'palustris']|nr:hypothetical protein SpCBS45565_g05217 [Spizellomyces sp. 'palustris']
MSTITKKVKKDRLSLGGTSTPKKEHLKSSQFKLITTKLYVHLPPAFVGNEEEGVSEHLSNFLMRYVPEVDGVVLAYSDVEVLEHSARILYDSPFFHFYVRANLLTFSPSLKSNLVGVVNKVSPDHIGLLVHGVFNASIPADQIRRKEFKWDENAAGWRRSRGADGEEDMVVGPGSVIRFTVTDLTKAKEMLTIVGSLVTDPENTGVIVSPDLPPAPLPELHEEEEEDSGVTPMDGIEENGTSPKPEGTPDISSSQATPRPSAISAKLTPASAKRKRTQVEVEEEEEKPLTPTAVRIESVEEQETPSEKKPKKKKQKIKEEEETVQVKKEEEVSDGAEKEKGKKRNTRGKREGRTPKKEAKEAPVETAAATSNGKLVVKSEGETSAKKKKKPKPEKS